MRSINYTHITNLFIYIYAFIMPFEQKVMPGFNITYGKLIGGILIILLIRYFSLKKLKSVIYPLILFVIWLVVIELLKIGGIHRMVTSLAQSIFLMILLVNYLWTRHKVLENMFFSLMLSIGYIGLMVLFGVDIEYSADKRLIYQDSGINALGFWAAIAIVIIINKIKNKDRRKIIYLFVGMIPLYFNIILKGGSRGAIIALLFGIAGLFVLDFKKVKFKLIYLIAGFILVFSVWNFAMNSSVMQKRMNSLIKTGDKTRTSVWKVALPIFYEHALIGISPSKYMPIIKERLGVEKDVHNAYLYIIVTSGIVGGILFLFFLINLFQFVYKTARVRNNYILLILLLLQFFDWFKGGGSLYPKTTWFLITFILAGSLNYMYKAEQEDRKNLLLHSKP